MREWHVRVAGRLRADWIGNDLAAYLLRVCRIGEVDHFDIAVVNCATADDDGVVLGSVCSVKSAGDIMVDRDSVHFSDSHHRADRLEVARVGGVNDFETVILARRKKILAIKNCAGNTAGVFKIQCRALARSERELQGRRVGVAGDIGQLLDPQFVTVVFDKPFGGFDGQARP